MKLRRSKVRGKNKANLFKIKGRSIWLCLSISWKFNVLLRDEQKASLGVLLTVVKYEIGPSTILIKEGKLYLLLAYLYH